MKNSGIKLNSANIIKIWNWTQDDIKDLGSATVLYWQNRKKAPSNAYAIYLVCLMDIWGSIVLDKFGDETPGHSQRNIIKIIDMLHNYNPTNYLVNNQNGKINEDLVKTLRHNLAHQYGLRNLSTGNPEEHLNIDVNTKQEIINQQVGNSRWHVDCYRLGKDILIILENWLKGNRIINE